MFKKQKPKPPKRKPKRRSSGPVLVRHPMSGIAPDVMRAGLAEMAVQSAAEYPAALARVLEILREINPLHLLSVLAIHGLTGAVTRDGVQQRSKDRFVEQHHVELLQALVLTVPPAELGRQAGHPIQVQEAINALNALAKAFHQRRYLQMQSVDDLQQGTVIALQERLRMHTQMVRNWGYYQDVNRISLALYSHFDAPLTERLGYSATNLITVAKALVSLYEARLSQRIHRQRRVFRERSVAGLIKAFNREYPDTPATLEDITRAVGEVPTWEMAFMFLQSYLDTRLDEIATFRANEIAVEAGLSAVTTSRVLEALSLQSGALLGADPEHFFMTNPIWSAPVIQVADIFYCVLPQSISSHIHDVMRRILESVGLTQELADRRADYLEGAVHALLETALPGAALQRNCKWQSGGVAYETDHLALLDRTLVIVEDKSGALSESGLRGAPERVKRHVRELIADPSEQSDRLQSLIRKAQAGDASAAADIEPLHLPFTAIDQIVRVSVTLDDFSILSSAEAELKDTGWIAADMALAPTINLADFGCVVDITSTPYFFVHYLLERGRVQKAVRIFADELDYIGFYLVSGFSTAEIEKQGISLTISGMSAAVDRYYNSRDAGIEIRKPRPAVTPYFRSLLDTLYRRNATAWLTMTTALLQSAGPEDQKKLDKVLRDLRTNVLKNWRDPAHQSGIVAKPPEGRDTAIVFYVYPPQLHTSRKEFAGNMAQKALETSQRDRCLVIARNTAHWDKPYTFVVIATADGAPDPV